MKKSLKKVYISAEDKSRALAYVDDYEIAKDIYSADYVLICIFKGQDLSLAKRDLNYALDHKKLLSALIFDDAELDAGLKIQLGLVKKYYVYDEVNMKAKKEINTLFLKEDPKKFPLKIFLLVILAIVVIVVFKFTGTEENPVQIDEPKKTETVELDKTVLEAFVSQGYDLDSDGKISKEEMVKITKLDLSNLGISDISFICYATNLKELDLSNNKITDVTVLAALNNLEKLNIKGNDVKNLQPLDYLPNLAILNS